MNVQEFALDESQLSDFSNGIDKSGPVPENHKHNCWNWTGQVTNKNIGIVSIAFGEKVKTFIAHRLAMMICKKRHLDKHERIYHTCRNSLCVNPRHLRIREMKPIPFRELTEDQKQSFVSQIDFVGDCWNWTGWKNKKGECCFKRIVNGKHFYMNPLRLSFMIFNNHTFQDDEVVVRNCGNKDCMRPDHADIITKAELRERNFAKTDNSQN